MEQLNLLIGGDVYDLVVSIEASLELMLGVLVVNTVFNGIRALRKGN